MYVPRLLWKSDNYSIDAYQDKGPSSMRWGLFTMGWSWFCMVEATGVEPASEDLATRTSTGVDCLLKCPYAARTITLNNR